jgi:hypothetical protein
MIKRTIRFVSYLLAPLGMIAVDGCSKDDDELCYKCTYTYGGDSYTESICYDYFKKYYGGSKEDFKDYIDSEWVDDGWTCKKK